MNALDALQLVRSFVPRGTWKVLSTGAGAALLLLAMQHPEAFMTLVTWIGEQKTADVLERAEGFMLELARRDLPNRPRGPIAV